MNSNKLLIIFLLTIIIFGNRGFAATDTCKQLTEQLIVYGNVWDSEGLKSLGVHKSGSVPTRVYRYGNPIDFNMPGRIPGKFEVEISKLKSLHPIPNPIREGSSQKLRELEEVLEDFGYNLKYPVQVALMRNGTLRIVGGHHRVMAMHHLGESYVPAQIIIWDAMRDFTKNMYRDEFILPLRKQFPEYYQELEEFPDLFN